jgi:hypothetical protein
MGTEWTDMWTHGTGDNRVFPLNKDNYIECNIDIDSDCPRYVEKITSTDLTPSTTPILDLRVQFLTCGGEVCVGSEDAFCDHPLGQKDPECLNCKTEHPNPSCYRPGTEQQRQCCHDITSKSDAWWRSRSRSRSSVKALHPNFDLAECLACSHISPSNSIPQCSKWLEQDNPCRFVAFAIGAFPPDLTSSLGGLSAARLQNLSTRKQSSCRTGQCRARDARTGRAK